MPSDERRDVEQQHVLDVAAQHAGLDGGADGDDLVGVDRLVGLLAGELMDESCTAGMRVEPPTRITWWRSPLLTPASLSACSNGMRQRSIRSAVISWNLARVSDSSRCSGPSAVAVMNGRLIWVCWTWLSSILAFSAASFRRCAGHPVGRQVDAVGALELLHQPVDDALVPVVAAELRVAVGRLDLEHAVADLEHRHVERAAAEVEHQDGLVLGALVEAVGQRRRGGLVDDAQHLETGDRAGFLGGGALGVVEVGGHGDDGLGDGVAEVALGVALELHQRAGADLLGGVALAVDVVGLPALAHVALDRAERAVGVGDRLALGHLADEHLAGLGERDDRRGRARALGVGDDDGVAGFEDGDDGVGGTEVDTDCLGHGGCSFRDER